MDDRRPLEAITFDCWSTLLHEATGGHAGYDQRVAAVSEITGVELTRAVPLIEAAWSRHHDSWVNGVQFGAEQMANHICEALGADRETERRLSEAFCDASLNSEIVALEGAAETLELIKGEGIKTALICDTGFSPGRVVRKLLGRVGLLDFLDVLVFSNEVGYPKPNAKMFEAALGPLAVEPTASAHVGDLKRTDIAGARAFGMTTVRIRAHNDDDSDHPDADHIVDSHYEIPEVLGIGTQLSRRS